MWDPRTYVDTDYGLEPGETFEPEDAFEEPEIDVRQPHVMTVLGPILADDLGICLHHTHLLCDPVALTGTDPDYRLDREDAAVSELEAFATMNGRAVVDCSTRDYGRNAAGLARIAGLVPLHIIGVTGRHTHRHASRMTNALDVASLAEEFIADIRHGMDGTSARAGAIAVGTSRDEITDVEAAVIDAAAAAHRATGVPITTHIEAGTMALPQLERLARAGVDPTRAIVGQLDRRMAWDELVAIARAGAFLSFDQIGKPQYGADAERAHMLVRLADAGFGDQLLISQDLTRRSEWLAYGGRPGLAYLMERFTLDLMAAGAEAMLVRRMLVDNPARAMTIHPPGTQV